MDNHFTRTFPDVMRGKKIVYFHGFCSSAQSGTVALLSELLPSTTIRAVDIPVRPAEALELLRDFCAREQPDLIVGTSMGGMYAEQMAGYDRLLVNPAFQIGETMTKHGMVGKQTFQNPRADGVGEFIVTKALVKEYAEAASHCFSHVSEEERCRVVGMFGDEDPVVHTYDLFREHYPTAIRFHGEHRLNDKVALHYLIPVIRQIDDRQEQRQRPIVYISWDAMTDAYGKPTASLHKAYEALIEHYSVYIVAPAPTGDPQSMAERMAWVERWLSAPAYDSVVFTNQPQLLYGDYFIGARECKDFMGTSIVWGSEEMKTWEEIIVFFDRLGGQ